LEYILRQSHPDLYAKYKDTLLKLRKVIEHRNILAHGRFIQEVPMPDFIKAKINRPPEVMVETFRKGQVVGHTFTLKEANAKVKEAKLVVCA